MQVYDWKNFKGGWFVGNFLPTLFSTENVEVCIKRYKKGDYDQRHLHKVATEITMIIDGQVTMNEVVYNPNDIIVINPGESTDFLAMTDATTCVVKLPCVKNDKYMV